MSFVQLLPYGKVLLTYLFNFFFWGGGGGGCCFSADQKLLSFLQFKLANNERFATGLNTVTTDNMM